MPAPQPSKRGHARLQDHAAIALVSMAILLFEILITRLLSVTLSYHFAFLAISLAMFGLAAPGVWMSVRPPGPRALLYALMAGALSLPLSVLGIVHLGASLRGMPSVWVAFLLAPMLALGSGVCVLLLGARGGAVARMYAADLAGGALGAVLAVPLLSGLPTPSVIAALGILPLAALTIVESKGRMKIAVLAVLLGASAVWGEPYRLRYTRVYLETQPPLYERWTPTARITVHPQTDFKGWGTGANHGGAALESLWIDQDGSAGTPIVKHARGARIPESLLYDITAAPYELGLGPRACIIGGGGGRDILSALAAGVEQVEVVELNPWTVAAVSKVFADYSGDPYHLPGVRSFVGEGRSHFARPGPPCDVLQISQIDTFAASAAGAYALTENSLYTVEAIHGFMRRLSPGGALSITRWARGPAWPESARLVLLVAEALRLAGVADPTSHLLVLASKGSANVMAFRKPVGAELLSAANRIAEHRGFERWWPLTPGEQASSPVALVLAHGPRGFEQQGYDLSPTFDDRPFFFQTLHLLRGSVALAQRGTGERELSVAVLRALASNLTILTAILLLLPVVLRKQLPRTRGWGRATLYFGCIGVGFMFIEIPLLQRLTLYLGHPSYATTAVLGSLLLGAGIGSALATHVSVALTKLVALLVPMLVSSIAFGLTLAIIPVTQGLELTSRIAITIAAVGLLGVPMGMLFPLGMRDFDGRDRTWYWAVNGAAGVLASVLALVLALLEGFSFVLWLAVAVYVIAALALKQRPPSSQAGQRGDGLRPHRVREN
jgi:hypothetical protein